MPGPAGRPGAFVTGSSETRPFVLGAGFLRIFATSLILAYSAASRFAGARRVPALPRPRWRDERMFASPWDGTQRLSRVAVAAEPRRRLGGAVYLFGAPRVVGQDPKASAQPLR